MKNIARKMVISLVALTLSSVAVAGSGAGVGLERHVGVMGSVSLGLGK